uniref:Ladderlectin-like n=1 Tax=Cynoglossus semilaevis TaxID=244447 RepID=A0A3P8UV96_CYNSE
MKTILLLTVLFSVVLSIMAAAVPVEAEPAPVEVGEEKLVEEVDPMEPEVEEPGVFVEEMNLAPEARFYTCPTGWNRYKNGCYQFVSSTRTWTSAASYCNSFGASLPSVHDLFEYSFLQDLTLKAGQSTCWIGGFYFQGWRWLDQSTYSYQNWNSQLSVTSYPCVYLNGRGRCPYDTVTSVLIKDLILKNIGF